MSIQACDSPTNDSIHDDSTSERTQLLNPSVYVSNSRIHDRVRPVTYESINSSDVASHYGYNAHLDSDSGSSNTPSRIVSEENYVTIQPKIEEKTQSSIITIFSIWNTMMGSSILSMPWALQQAGFGLGIALMIIVAGIALYTAYRILQSPKSLDLLHLNHIEFSDICGLCLGKPGKYISIAFSVVALLGATIVYWVLLSNFLYNIVLFIYQKIDNGFNSTSALVNGSYSDVFCPQFPNMQNKTNAYASHFYNLGLTNLHSMSENKAVAFSSSQDIFSRVWHKTNTVPVFLLVIVVPLINFKSPTFFTKLNAFGTAAVLFIMVFVLVKGIKWGLHMDSQSGVTEFKPTFPSLTGVLSLAYFIHNCVLSIMRNQRKPENNGRDLSIAYILVAATYIFVGVTFYCTFPLSKSCIEDNLLNNFVNSDILAFISRIFLFIQITTVFPLLMFILRTQVLQTMFGSIYPSLKHVLVLNGIVLGCCVLVAELIPQIGLIIRISGSICGLAYVFTLPCVIYMLVLHRQSYLTWPVIIIHVIIIIIGILNFMAQFLILGLE